MASLAVFDYYFYEPSLGVFYPGQRRTKWFSWDWRGKSATATAQPFDAWGQDRQLTVENLSMRTFGLIDPNAPPIQYVTLEVVNTGRDPIMIYTVQLVAFIP